MASVTGEQLIERPHAGLIGDHCRRGINKLMNAAASSSLAEDSSLQRHFRDINMLATHAFMDWETSAEQYGRTLLGLEPTSPLI